MKKIFDLKALTDIKVSKAKGRYPPIIDYNTYVFTLKEVIMYVAMKAAFLGMVSYLFYDSVIAWIIMLPIAVISLKSKGEELCKKRKRKLETEFREVILSVSSNLQAGYSIENAFREAYQDIVVLYGEESVMARELYLMMQRLNNNELLEDILVNLSKRSGVADIKDFADIFQIAKRSGGDLRGIIANTAQIISDKQEVTKEIETVMSEKKLEQTIMRYIPFFIVFYISLTSKGYFESLYHNLLGWIVMSVCLVIYVVACKISDKILDINI